MSGIARVDVLGVGVSVVNRPTAVHEITRWIDTGERHYVCVSGVPDVMESRRDPEVLRAHNGSGLTVPEGTPLVRAGHRAGAPGMRQVTGPDLMLDVLARAVERGWTSYFYGGAKGVPEMLASHLGLRFPGLKVAGAYSPPARPLTPREDAAITARVNGSGADLVWVGLPSPGQERWMAEHRARLENPVLLGVGGAFDVHTGRASRAPEWMARYGLEWSYRLVREPGGPWRRLLRDNPAYLVGTLRRRPRLLDADER
ncbi:WecB/TagA/CpsF family glycosyltransferase [Yinghuangia sp. YIM S09857]|uniref:WecB/TagA/CpsF family glycosyltransferase n=1 Tax=Yinghuangia sp. YIM S09857 TaxID=3436929 RepID=UPI003F529E04